MDTRFHGYVQVLISDCEASIEAKKERTSMLKRRALSETG